MQNWASPWERLRQPVPMGQADSVALRWHPSQLATCVEARGERMPQPLNETERASLRRAHEAWGADGASLAAIDRLGATGVRVVITGQQPGFLAGPLLVIYKTIGAVLLARQLKARHPELDFVPVFWVAGEDHDFDEVRRVFWPSHQGELQEYVMPEALWRSGGMIGNMPTGAALPALLEQIVSSTFPTEYVPEVMALLQEAYGGEGTLQDGFCRILLRLLRGTGLVIVSPLMEWVRRRSLPIFEQEIDRPGWSSQVVIDRGEAIREEGGEPTLHRHPDAINLFWIDEQERRYALKIDQGRVVRTLAAHGGQTAQADSGETALPPLELDTLRRMLAADPLRFSTNVVTRPLVQDSILPTVAQMIGPGEASYLSQVEGIYEAFGVLAPVRYPRPQVTLLEPRVARKLEKHQLALDEALQLDAPRLATHAIRRTGDNQALDAVGELSARQRGEVDELKQRLAGGDAVDAAFEKLAQGLEKGYRKIEDRLIRQQHQDEASLGKAIALIANSLHPADQVQERVLNPLAPFAINYGLDWAQALMARLDVDPAAGMQVIRTEDLKKQSN